MATNGYLSVSLLFISSFIAFVLSAMESQLVIKVKFENTFKRFNVSVDENNRMDLKMVELRAKIRSDFNFTDNANFSLRYVDEEGDLVNLVDDDDLHDMMRQQLKYLRIEVQYGNGFFQLRKMISKSVWKILQKEEVLYYGSTFCGRVVFSKSNIRSIGRPISKGWLYGHPPRQPVIKKG
ncbi:protein JOKA2 [Medicago truncatula]|uniref:PB1 domain protein n=1 Tax=Medicago truncatula TaxID=3880 RepID=A0A072UQZ7_MEDTR|nr:protein JOKA2 [Medicago truncatula]KEH31776.1 PB1 domain protein [Medicago truncatula]